MGKLHKSLHNCVLLVATLAVILALGNCHSLHRDSQCTKKGFYRDKDDCAKFYRCVEKPIISNHDQASPGLERHEFTCPPGLIFDSKLYTCNYQERVKVLPGECTATNNPIKAFPNCEVEGNKNYVQLCHGYGYYHYIHHQPLIYQPFYHHVVPLHPIHPPPLLHYPLQYYPWIF